MGLISNTLCPTGGIVITQSDQLVVSLLLKVTSWTYHYYSKLPVGGIITIITQSDQLDVLLLF